MTRSPANSTVVDAYSSTNAGPFELVTGSKSFARVDRRADRLAARFEVDERTVGRGRGVSTTGSIDQIGPLPAPRPRDPQVDNLDALVGRAVTVAALVNLIEPSPNSPQAVVGEVLPHRQEPAT